jgi:uncharacterized protein YjbI with pentapeptide repeats
MIRTKKLTPLAYGYRVTSRRPPQVELAVIVRAKLTCRPGEPCELVRTELEQLDDKADVTPETQEQLDEAEYILGQGPPRADVFEDDDDMRAGQVIYPGDFAEFKVKSDVILRGTCYPPRKDTTQCGVAFGVGERFFKELRVIGPRVWTDKVLGGKHTDPLTFESMPVDYRHAYGGPELADNPVGKGHDQEELANIEIPGDPHTPAGFGPINPEWPLRSGKMGKNYGDGYEAREPWYADDYDWTQQNAAPADQQLDGYLRSDEKLHFVNLHPEAHDFTVQLPGLRPRAFVEHHSGDRVEVQLSCDTLFADMDEGVVYLTWRGHCKVKEDDLSDLAFLLIANEKLSDEPKPPEFYLSELEAFSNDPIGLSASPVAKLQEFEENLESGELERRIDELGENDEPVAAVFGDLIAFAPDSEEILKQLQEQLDNAAEKDPQTREELKAKLKEMLREIREGGGGGGGGMSVDTEGGGANVGPLMRQVMRQVATQQKDALDAGADLSETNAELVKAIAAADVPGVTEEDLAIPDPNEPPPEPAPGVDFSGHDLSDRDLSGLDLHGCKFEGTILTRTNLSGCNLEGANFSFSALQATRLTDANCKEADFTLARWSGTKAHGADLSGATIDQCAFLKADLTNVKLHGASATTIMVHKSIFDGAQFDGAEIYKGNFDNTSLNGCTFRECKMPMTLFRQCSMAEVRFDGADLSSAGFLECQLDSAVFFQANADTANFKDSSLRKTDFSYAKLPSCIFMGVQARGANLFCADMPRARFYRAVLREANFDKANLFEADMRKTSLTKATFIGANLYKSAFIEAFGTDADFSKANIGMANFKRNKLVTK